MSAAATSHGVSANESMAVAKMREVAEETKRRFPEISEVGIWHRVGMLEVGETSLLVAVRSDRPTRLERLVLTRRA